MNGELMPAPTVGEQLATREISGAQKIAACCLGTFLGASLLVGFSDDVRATATEMMAACPVPAAESVEAVESMFDAPQPEPVYSAAHGKIRAKERDQFEVSERQRLGITLPAFDKAKMFTLNYSMHTSETTDDLPFAEYKDMLSGILGQSGIRLVIGPPKSEQVHAKTPTADELETVRAKARVQGLIDILAYTPTAIVANAPMKKIAITAHMENNAGLVLAGEETAILDVANSTIDTPEEDDEHSDGVDLAAHELAHIIIDSATCGPDNMHDDPGYEKLNDKGQYSGEWPLPKGYETDQPPTFATISDQYYALERAKRTAQDAGDEQAANNAERQLEDLMSPVEMMDPYSLKNAAEDKANVGRNIFDPMDYKLLLDKRMPVIRDKFIYLLARLYEKLPNVVKYYNLMTWR